MAEEGLGGPQGQRFSVDEKLRIIEEARSPSTTVAEVLRRYQVDGARGEFSKFCRPRAMITLSPRLPLRSGYLPSDRFLEVASAVGAAPHLEVSTALQQPVQDRLLHRATTINIRGESYRLRHRRQAGLSTPPLNHGAAQPTSV